MANIFVRKKAEGASEINELAAELDTGARDVDGWVGHLLFGITFAWALFQIYVASPLPFILGKSFIFNAIEVRAIHFAFAIFLAFCLFPASHRSARKEIPAIDWVIAIIAASSALYLVIFHKDFSGRVGAPIGRDIACAIVGMLCLLEATRRVVGLPLVIVALLFILHAMAGDSMPDLIRHKSADLGRMSEQMWLSTEAVFGIALGVSANFIFLFVMFGAMLERAGAASYFVQVSFAALGHLRGGPAKAAVVSSALTGMISGSALANVVTTGTFTIPLMKRLGFSPEKAAAVESSSSINGQLMPPVMGAAAFIMTDFVGIPYVDVIKHAFLPAVISYLALFYIVHLEAVKHNMPVLEKLRSHTILRRISGAVIAFGGMVLLSAFVYYGLSWIKQAFGDATVYVAALLFVASYLGLLWLSTRVPPLVSESADVELTVPDMIPTLLAGLHFLLPVVVLIWCLMVEHFSPSLSIYYAILAMTFVMLTQRPLTNWMRGSGNLVAAFRQGVKDVIQGMAQGARNMVGIGIALGAAGIIVGVVSMTGLGIQMVTVVEVLSGGNLLLTLVLTAIIAIVLGMGLPTTANYIVVASVAVPVVSTLAVQGGLVLPPIAIHMFVLYCGLMSGNTPPVAVDAYAAAAIARSRPFKTCMQAFYYSMRTMLLPFIFVFNTQLLLIDIGSIWELAVVVGTSVVAMLLFVAATQRFFLVRTSLLETFVFLLVSFSLLLPGFWLDKVYPPFRSVDPIELLDRVAEQPEGSVIRLWVSGERFGGDSVTKVVVFQLGAPNADGAERLLEAAGFAVAADDDKMLVEDLTFNGPAQQQGMDYGWQIDSLEEPTLRPSKYWIYAFALLLLAPFLMSQRRRAQKAQRRPANGSNKIADVQVS